MQTEDVYTVEKGHVIKCPSRCGSLQAYAEFNDIVIAVLCCIRSESHQPLKVLSLFAHNPAKSVRLVDELRLASGALTVVEQTRDILELQEYNFTQCKVPVPTLLNMSVAEFLRSGHRDCYNVFDFDPVKKNLPELYDVLMEWVPTPGYLVVNVPEFGLISGNAYLDKCTDSYGGPKMSKHSATVEFGVRLVLQKLYRAASGLHKSISVLLTYYQSGCAKLFLKIEGSVAALAPALAPALAHCYYCQKCDFYTYLSVQLCPTCASPLHRTGEFWTGPLKDIHFLSSLCAANPATESLRRLRDELDVPLSISPSKRYRTGAQKPLRQIMALVSREGYRVSPTQFDKDSIKTDCPLQVLDQILG